MKRYIVLGETVEEIEAVAQKEGLKKPTEFADFTSLETYVATDFWPENKKRGRSISTSKDGFIAFTTKA